MPSDIDAAVPPTCELTLALVLSRHGSRDPTARKSDTYHDLIERLQDDVTDYAPGFEFIKEYDYSLGSDELTDYGENEMVQSGEAFFERYKALVKSSDPFIRAAGSNRVIESAKKFAKGLADSQERELKARRGLEGRGKDILIIPEEEGFNNTLNANHGACPAFQDGPAAEVKDKMQAKWKETWVPPVTSRLNSKLTGANLTLDETIYLMDLCPFNTVADSGASPSEFCRLFSLEEWRNYDYFMSLDKWYGYGPGNPLAPSLGVGYVNEVIARLTGEPVEDSTTVNSTLDASPETFPLDRRLYADFSHDNSMSTVYAALGLYNGTEHLPVTRRLGPEKTGGYSAAWTVPFAGRMYVEKMRCSEADGEEELVRVLMNDRVVPLKNCDADGLGRCRLGAFVESLSFARGGGLWHECFR